MSTAGSPPPSPSPPGTPGTPDAPGSPARLAYVDCSKAKPPCDSYEWAGGFVSYARGTFSFSDLGGNGGYKIAFPGPYNASLAACHAFVASFDARESATLHLGDTSVSIAHGKYKSTMKIAQKHAALSFHTLEPAVFFVTLLRQAISPTRGWPHTHSAFSIRHDPHSRSILLEWSAADGAARSHRISMEHGLVGKNTVIQHASESGDGETCEIHPSGDTVITLYPDITDRDFPSAVLAFSPPAWDAALDMLEAAGNVSDS